MGRDLSQHNHGDAKNGDRFTYTIGLSFTKPGDSTGYQHQLKTLYKLQEQPIALHPAAQFFASL
jgi:hypothetical protein